MKQHSRIEIPGPSGRPGPMRGAIRPVVVIVPLVIAAGLALLFRSQQPPSDASLEAALQDTWPQAARLAEADRRLLVQMARHCGLRPPFPARSVARACLLEAAAQPNLWPDGRTGPPTALASALGAD